MTILVLEGITHKGKNRIRECGSIWEVHNRTDKVLFNPEPGPWLFISPAGMSLHDRKSRWIKEIGDTDFRIVRQI
jgi:hypothetical protein